MNFEDILKELLRSIINNTPRNDFKYLDNKLNICEESIDYVTLFTNLLNLSKIEYRTNSYFLHPVLIMYINNYIKEKNKEFKVVASKLSDKLILDYKLVKKVFYEYGRKKKKDINIKMLYDNLKKLSDEELICLNILKSDINDLESYINECSKVFNDDLTFETERENILFLIVKRIINILIKRNKYELLRKYNLDLIILEPIVESDLCDYSESIYNNICGFLCNNKDLFLKENVLNDINSKIDLFTYDEELMKLFPKIIEDKTKEKTIRNNKQRLSLIFNRMIIYNEIYKKYGIEAVKRADKINKLIFENYYVLLADKLNLDDDEEIDENLGLIQKIVKVDKTLPNIIFDNDYLSDNIISQDEFNLILDLFDPNSQFKDLTNIELVNILLNIFICDEKLKYVDDNKYKDLSKEIKTIINKRNKD